MFNQNRWNQFGNKRRWSPVGPQERDRPRRHQLAKDFRIALAQTGHCGAKSEVEDGRILRHIARPMHIHSLG